MNYVTEPFSAHTFATLEADANTLPIADAPMNDLLALLEDEETYTFATIRTETTYETVRLYVRSGVLLMERGQGGTTAVTHPCVAHVSLVSPTTIEAVKAVMCEYDCCEAGDCECEPVAVLGVSTKDSWTVGDTVSACVVFSGTLPMFVATDNVPSWLTATVIGNVVAFEGVAANATNQTITVAAANCNGQKLAIHRLALVVEEA